MSLQAENIIKRDEIACAQPSRKAFSARSNLDSTLSCGINRAFPGFARTTGQEERTPRDLAALCEHVKFCSVLMGGTIP